MVHATHIRIVGAAPWALAVLLLCTMPGCEKRKARAPQKGSPMKLTLTSTAFAGGQPIPRKYTGDGADVSPPLAWSAAPGETKELALIMDDPDAPTPQPWVHWVIYKIPAGTERLPEAIATADELATPSGALQGKNSSGSIGYRGPAPPGGVHHYCFTLYALDAELDLESGASKEALLAAMAGHILAEAQLIGTYQR